jgi:peptidoglycan-associated lipoprotein
MIKCFFGMNVVTNVVKERKMNIWKLLVPMCAFIIVGCAGQSATETADETSGTDAATTSGTGADGSGTATPIDSDLDAKSLMNNRVVYFEFDSAELDDASVELLKLHAAYLAENSDAKVRLEGHADERGSREYNIGLGERRAASVKSLLQVQGASSSQLTTISFGEERPADTGTGEMSWARNRRVELAYR